MKNKYDNRGWKMSFIGIVAGKKCFENIKRKITEEMQDETINFIQINLRSIENIKNVKFETIIVEDNLDKFKNQKATVTISSISDTDILIYWQKSIQDREGQKIEIEERRIKRKGKKSLKTYEVLIIYSLFKIYRKSIIEEI